MEPYTKVNGCRTSDTAVASWNGRMVRVTTVTGTMVWRSGKESSSISMETYMRGTGPIIRLMVMACTSMPKELGTRVNGRMTSNMVTGMRSGMRAANTKVDTPWGRKKAWESIHGQTDLHTTVNGKTIESMDKVSIYGRMAADTMVTGSTMTWMVSVFTIGQTDADMKGSSITIKSAALAFTSGPTDANTRDGGTRASNMALGLILILLKKK